jgi:broad specificity phosphatase PhoE
MRRAYLITHPNVVIDPASPVPQWPLSERGKELGLTYAVVDELGENDRSATGFLPPPEFERLADEFFAHPDQSIKGWETAAHAQQRIVDAVERVVAADTTLGSIAIVSHGAVGTLLYCHLRGVPIARIHDQPANGGGNYYSFDIPRSAPLHRWRAIDTLAT